MPTVLILSDSFTGTAGASLVGHLPDTPVGSATWIINTLGDGPLVFTNTGGVVGSGSGPCWSTIYPMPGTGTDGVFTFGFSSTSTGPTPTIYLRANDAFSDLLIFELSFNEQKVKVARLVAGSGASVGEASVTLAPNGTLYTLEITLDGTTLTGVRLGSPTLADLPTLAGLAVPAASGSRLWLRQQFGNAGDVVFKSVAYSGEATGPTTATVTGPSAPTVGTLSGSYTITTPSAVPAATAFTPVITGFTATAPSSVTVATGQTTAIFAITPTGAGVGNVSATSPGITVTGQAATATAPGGTTPIMRDSFNGTPGNSLAAHTPDVPYGSESWGGGLSEGPLVFLSGGGVTSSGSHAGYSADLPFTGQGGLQRVKVRFRFNAGGGDCTLYLRSDASGFGTDVVAFDLNAAAQQCNLIVIEPGHADVVVNTPATMAVGSAIHTAIFNLAAASCSTSVDGVNIDLNRTIPTNPKARLYLRQQGGGPGDTDFLSIEVSAPGPTAATITGPASPILGTASGAYTITTPSPVPEDTPFTPLITGFGATAPATVTIAAGQTTATFSITPSSAGAGTVGATAPLIAVTGRAATATVDSGSAPASATLANAPTTTITGVESAPIVATLDHLPTGSSTVINYISSVTGDTFRANVGGPAVTSATLAPGSSTQAALYLVASSTGPRSVSITSTGLTIAGSPLTVTAAALTATLTPPTVGHAAVDTPSAAFHVALNTTPVIRDVIVTPTSSIPGDTFRASPTGPGVTTLTVPGSTTNSVDFHVVPSTTGARSVSIAVAGATLAGSPATYTGDAPPSTVSGQLAAYNATPSLASVYFVVTRSGGKAWASTAFTALNATAWPTYAIAGADLAGVCLYLATMPPAIPAGEVAVYAYRKAGSMPAPTDTLIGTQAAYWDGTVLLSGGPGGPGSFPATAPVDWIHSSAFAADTRIDGICRAGTTATAIGFDPADRIANAFAVGPLPAGVRLVGVDGAGLGSSVPVASISGAAGSRVGAVSGATLDETSSYWWDFGAPASPGGSSFPATAPANWLTGTGVAPSAVDKITAGLEAGGGGTSGPVTLAPDALAAISTAEPASDDPNDWDFPARLNMVFRRLYNTVVKEVAAGGQSGSIAVKSDDGGRNLAVLPLTVVGQTQVQGRAQ